MSADERKNINVSIPGEALDQAAADVIRHTVGAAGEGAVSTAGDFLGGLFRDQVRDWRTRRLIDRAAETAALLRAKGVSGDRLRSLPMGEWYALFDGASQEDDETVGTLWSNLLANALDTESGVDASRDIIGVLKQLTAKDAQMLQFISLYERKLLEYRDAAQSQQFDVGQMWGALNQSDEERARVAREIAAHRERVAKKQRPLVAEVKQQHNELKNILGDEGVRATHLNLQRLSLVKNFADPEPVIQEALRASGRERSEYVYDLDDIPKVINAAQIQVLEAMRKALRSPSLTKDGDLIENTRFMGVNPDELMPELVVQPSDFGKRFLRACDVEGLREKNV